MVNKNNISPSFNNQDFYIGLDVHKKQWTLSIITMNMLIKNHLSIDPSPSILLKYMQRHYPDGNYHAAYESGFSGFWAAREMNGLGIDCMVIHAPDIPSSQKERMNKNDRVDSRKIARSLSNGELKPLYIPEQIAEEYRYLNRHRLRTIKDQTRFKNRIKSTLHQFGIRIPLQYQDRRWSGCFIDWLLSINFETEYARFAYTDLVDQLIQTRTRVTTHLKKMRLMAKEQEPFITLLLTIPGIGFITAMTLATEIIDMNRFSTLEKLASYVGLIPSIQSSDETEINYGITPRRNKHLRTMLIEAAWKVVKKDPALTMKFNQLSRRMNHNKAIVRITKILLNRIRYVWKNQKPYVLSVVK